jgi:hypothetical protein
MIRYLTIIVIALTTLGCDSTSSSSNYKLSGEISIEGVADLSGVTIALYFPTILDEDLLNYQDNYSSIGVQITQEMLFDHRQSTATKTVQANSDGTYEIKDVSSGEYNLVAYTDGFGWSYKTGITVGADRSNLNFTLFPETIVTSATSGSTTFEANHFYVIEQNVDFFVPLNIVQPCHFLITPNKKISFLNEVNINPASGQVRFTLSGNPATEKWLGIVVKNVNADISDIIIENAATGIISENSMNELQLNNVLITKSVIGFSALNSSPITIANSTLFGNENANIEMQLANISIVHSLIGKAELGINQSDFCETVVTNTIITGHEIGFQDVDTQGPALASPQITLSLFENNNLHDIYLKNSNMLVVANTNLLSDVALKVKADINNLIDNLNFQSNYWGTTNSIDITGMIYDYNDLTDSPNQDRFPIVDFSNFLDSPVTID